MMDGVLHDAVVVEPLKATYAQINDYAVRVGSTFGIYDDDGHANLDVLLDSLGGDVRVRDGNESSVVHDDGRFTVFVPSSTSPRRDRFTIAHEIGHYLLHYENAGRKQKVFTRRGSNHAETQANYFAAALIMPVEHFTQAFNELGGDLWKLARQFDVSPAAAEVRCSVLGLKK